MDSVIHKSYTAGFKLSVVDRAEKIGNRAAAREFNVDEKCVRRWRTDKNDLERMPQFKRAQRGGIVAWPGLERELESWIKLQDKVVTVLEIQTKAKLIAEQMGLTNFKGNINWCYRFMKRKQLSMNSKPVKQRDWNEQKSFFNCTGIDFKLTVVAKAKKIGDEAAAREFDLCERCVQKWRSNNDLKRKSVKQNSQMDCNKEKSLFLQNVTLAVQEKQLTDAQIINVDEIPFSFHFVNSKGDKAVPVLTAGNEKLSFTCVISCAANGDRLKPFVIFKRKSIPQGNYPADLVVRSSEKGAMCENLILDWLYEIWRKRKGAIFDPRGILIIDSIQKQLFDSVRSEYEEMSTILAVIPKGLTKLLHPLGFLINKTFENEMMKRYENWINSGLHSFTKGGKMRKATPEEIVEWVLESWKSVQVSSITYGFRQAGIISPKDGVNSGNSKRVKEIENTYDNNYEEIEEENVTIICDNDSEEIEREDINRCDNGYEEIKKENVNVCDNDSEEIEKEDINRPIDNGYEEIKKENMNSCNSSYEGIKKEDMNSCDNSSEGIRMEHVDRQTCVYDSDYEKINIKDEKSSDHLEGTVGVNEFLKSLFASDNDESEFEEY